MIARVEQHPEVELDYVQILEGLQVGAARRLKSHFNGYRQTAGETPTWDADIEGALAEMAFSKWAGVFFGGSVGQFKEADVGNTIAIRHTRWPNGRLILREGDPLEHHYILLTGGYGKYTIAGHIPGYRAKQSKFLSKPDPARPECYAVPQAELEPVGEPNAWVLR